LGGARLVRVHDMTDSAPLREDRPATNSDWQAHLRSIARHIPGAGLVPIEKFMRFAAVGVFGTAAHYLVLGTLVEFARTPVLAATTVGFATGAVVNYILNRRVTFVSEVSHVLALPKFLMVSALGAGLNWLIVGLLVHRADCHYFIAQIAATATVLLWNFAGNHLWTFRE